MSDQATLLRKYHHWLDQAKTPDGWRSRMLGFLIQHFPEGTDPPPGTRLISQAHLARVKGEGSPAECDSALQAAIKEITT